MKTKKQIEDRINSLKELINVSKNIYINPAVILKTQRELSVLEWVLSKNNLTFKSLTALQQETYNNISTLKNPFSTKEYSIFFCINYQKSLRLLKELTKKGFLNRDINNKFHKNEKMFFNNRSL